MENYLNELEEAELIMTSFVNYTRIVSPLNEHIICPFDGCELYPPYYNCGCGAAYGRVSVYGFTMDDLKLFQDERIKDILQQHYDIQENNEGKCVVTKFYVVDEQGEQSMLACDVTCAANAVFADGVAPYLKDNYGITFMLRFKEIDGKKYLTSKRTIKQTRARLLQLNTAVMFEEHITRSTYSNEKELQNYMSNIFEYAVSFRYNDELSHRLITQVLWTLLPSIKNCELIGKVFVDGEPEAVIRRKALQ